MNIIEITTNANVRTRKWLYEQLVKIDTYLQTLTGGGGIIDLTQEELTEQKGSQVSSHMMELIYTSAPTQTQLQMPIGKD